MLSPMKLLTKEIEEALRKANPSTAQHPICKFFNPCGRGTWLIFAMEDDGDTLWGVADLGMDCVEYGTISLSELTSLKFFGGVLGIERDLHWQPRPERNLEYYLGLRAIRE
jgi:hypothetical protein